MAVHPHIKKQKVDERATGTDEAVLFNSDTLSKIISYLPSVDLLNLALTCKRFSVSNSDDKISLIEESARIAIHDIATEEQLAALPHYDGESLLADYHYLQFMRQALTFDQLVGDVDYVNREDRSCVRHNGDNTWNTAFSNNVLRAGKHYALFSITPLSDKKSLMIGVMRPGKADQNASGYPVEEQFYQNFSRNMGHGEDNSKVHCCMYYYNYGSCFTCYWNTDEAYGSTWRGSESMSNGDVIGMLLDLDEGTLSVYKNGRKLGVMQSGLAGPYCWMASSYTGAQVTIKRGVIPPN